LVLRNAVSGANYIAESFGPISGFHCELVINHLCRRSTTTLHRVELGDSGNTQFDSILLDLPVQFLF